MWNPPAAESRGSPFPLPARLADGLDQGSDLKADYSVFCAPSVPVKDGRWVPRANPQEGELASAAMCLKRTCDNFDAEPRKGKLRLKPKVLRSY